MIQKLKQIFVILLIINFASSASNHLKVTSDTSYCSGSAKFELVIIEDYSGGSSGNHNLVFCIDGSQKATSKIILGPKTEITSNGSCTANSAPAYVASVGKCKKPTSKVISNLTLIKNTDSGDSTVIGKYSLCFKDVPQSVSVEGSPYCFHDSNNANGPSHGCIRVLANILNSLIIPTLGGKVFSSLPSIRFVNIGSEQQQAPRIQPTQPKAKSEEKPSGIPIPLTGTGRAAVLTPSNKPTPKPTSPTRPVQQQDQSDEQPSKPQTNSGGNKPSKWRNENCAKLRENIKKIGNNVTTYGSQGTERQEQLNYMEANNQC